MARTKIPTHQINDIVPYVAYKLTNDQALDNTSTIPVVFDTEVEDNFSMYNSELSKIKSCYRLEASSVDTISQYTGTDTNMTYSADAGVFGSNGAVFAGGAEGGTDQNLGNGTNDSTFDTTYWKAQPFIPTEPFTQSIELKLKKYGSPTGNLTVEIQTDNAGVPSGTVIYSYTIDVSTLTTSYAVYKQGLSTNGGIKLTVDTKYHLCMKGQSAWTSTDNVYTQCLAGTGFEQYNCGPGDFSLNGTTTQYYVKTYYTNAGISVLGNVLNFAGSFSIAGWMKKSAETSVTEYLICKAKSSDSSKSQYYVALTSSNHLRFVVFNTDGNAYLDCDSGMHVADNEWHFFVANYDSVTPRADFYIDDMDTAVASDTTTSGTVNTSSTSELVLGGYGSITTGKYSSTYLGYMDEVMFFDGGTLGADARNFLKDYCWYPGSFRLPEDGTYIVTATMAIKSGTNPSFYRPTLGYANLTGATGTFDRQIAYNYDVASQRYFCLSGIGNMVKNYGIYVAARTSGGATNEVGGGETTIEIVKLSSN